jgi:hypothetical protein
MIVSLLAILGMAQAAPPQPCTMRNAMQAEVRVMARDPDRWLNRCVRVQGYVRWNIFYADVGGAYVAEANDRADRLNQGWLGLYLRDGQRRSLRAGTVTGILRDCGRDLAEAEAAAGPNELVMGIGYCHYRSGLVLADARFRSRGHARFERLTDEAARVRFGDLDPEGPNLQPPSDVVALADRFLARVRAADGTGLAAFTGTWTEQAPVTPRAWADWHAYLSGAGDSPLRALRRVSVQRAYFRERQPRDDLGVDYRPDWFACFCQERDCTGRWPIHRDDATVSRHRPYACARAYNPTDRREPPDHLAIDRRDSTFAEPRTNSSTR